MQLWSTGSWTTSEDRGRPCHLESCHPMPSDVSLLVALAGLLAAGVVHLLSCCVGPPLSRVWTLFAHTGPSLDRDASARGHRTYTVPTRLPRDTPKSRSATITGTPANRTPSMASRPGSGRVSHKSRNWPGLKHHRPIAQTFPARRAPDRGI